ncbi:MAG: hypothetical protein AAFW65_01300 [Pseudomonadota bacterium]
MFDRQDLRAAVEADVISTDVAARLEAFLIGRSDPAGTADPESLRFLANFNDIFITIGIVILAIGLTATTGIIFGPSAATALGEGSVSMAGIMVLLPVAGAMWLLMEYFCGRRRLLLPSMALAAIFTLYAGLSVGLFASGLSNIQDANIESFFDAWETLGNAGIATFLGGMAAAGAIYARFRLPFSLFLLAVSLAGAVYTFAGFFGDIGLIIGGLGALLVGLATLVCAIVFDASDPNRATRRSDNAFWLHLAAAPQIIFGLRGMISGSSLTDPGPVEAVMIILVLVAFGALSLALNRRALIVSGLLTFSLALTTIVSSLGGGVTTTLIVTTLLLGTGILLLGGGWKTARRMLLTVLPRSGVAGRLFPPEPA